MRLKTTSLGRLADHFWMNGSRRAQCGQPYQKNSITSILPPPSVGCGGLRRENSACWAEAPPATKARDASAEAKKMRIEVMGGFLFFGVFGGADDRRSDAVLGQRRLDSVRVVHALVRAQAHPVEGALVVHGRRAHGGLQPGQRDLRLQVVRIGLGS